MLEAFMIMALVVQVPLTAVTLLPRRRTSPSTMGMLDYSEEMLVKHRSITQPVPPMCKHSKERESRLLPSKQGTQVCGTE
jgi:hypothetical protein